MDVFEAIERRHSVRAYLPDPVPEEKLARTARLRKKMEEIASLDGFGAGFLEKP